jgi:molecular chaperone GrpE
MDAKTQAEQRPDEHGSAAPAEIARLQQELRRARELQRRTLADFDNYRKRVQRDQDRAAQAGKRQLVLALLDVLDDFERALAYASTAPEATLAGARVIHQRLADLLRAQGVVPYISAGQPFDAALHEAVDVINTDQATPGVVLDELRHGYRWGDEVLRPARVRVAQ